MVTRTYADAFRHSESVRLTGVCARSEASRDAFLAANADLGAVAMTVEEIAADPGIDFAILTTPPNARAEIVGKLAAAGKPILMEKPVERTLAGATRLVELCEGKGVPLGHTIPVREVRLSAGAEFVVVICGDIMTMPGLPRVPAANSIELASDGRISGLF